MAILKIFKPHLFPNGKIKVRLSQNLVRGVAATWRFRMAKTVLFRYLRWRPCIHLEDLYFIAQLELFQFTYAVVC